MWKATLRGVLARRVRLTLTAVAVMLGVAFVTGTYVLTDTLRRSFDDIFRETVAGVDVVVRGQAPQEVGFFSTGAFAPRTRVPERVLAEVRAVDGVATADGLVQGYAQFVDPDGDSVQNGPAPTLGISWGQSEAVGPLRLRDDGVSRPPRADGEVAMDMATARAHGFEVGDRVRVLLQGPAEEFTIVGLFGLGDADDLGGVTFAGFDLVTAQRVFAAPGVLDAVNVTGDPGVPDGELRSRLQEELGPGFEVVAADVVADETGAPVRQFFDLFNAALLGFAAVGLVVGGFIIFNTFSILVAQRTRELGLLRAMGASERQVMTSVVAEAFVIGAIAAAAGLAAGIVVATLLLGVVERFGFDVPRTDPVLLGRTVVLAFAVGLVVTVGSALFPATRAARTTPIAAIHDFTRTTATPLRRRAVVGTVVTAVGLAVFAAGLAASPRDVVTRLVVIGLGALGIFLGVVVLVATFARPLAGVVGWPMAWWLGATGTLARENAMRNPRRTAATASALVVGLGLVGLVAIFAASTKASLREAVEGGVRADFVLSTEELTGFSPQVAQRLRDLPALEAVTGLRLAQIEVDGTPEFLVGVDAAALPAVIDLGRVEGGLDGLAEGGILLQEAEADAYDVDVGDRLAVTLAARGAVGLPVAGVYSQPNFLGGFPVPTFVVAHETYDANFGGNQQESLVYAKARDGRVDEARGQIENALADDFPNVDVNTRAEFREGQEDAVDEFLAVLVALLLLSELIAVLGIINTLLLSVYERTRELGLLRAVGMSRRQVRRVIRGESLIIAFIGGILGLVVGVFWGWAFTAALEQQGITEFTVPVGQVLLFLALSVVAGLLAALLPAWRAGRLDVLEAIATE